MTSRVTIGSDAKGDCRVSIEAASELTVEVQTKAAQLVGRGVRTVAERAVARFGDIKAAVLVEDFGALDYVLDARLETALRVHSGAVAPPLKTSIQRHAAANDAPRRSRLYAPGNNPRLLTGIEVHGADCVLLDLEDSVPISEKESARCLVKHLLASIPFPREVWVRINPLDSGGQEDVREVLAGRPHGVCLPKAESAQDIQALALLLTKVESELGLEPGFTKIMAILETAKGVLHAAEIAAADPRLVMLAFGAEDFTRDIGAQRSRRSLLFARSQLVAAAKAAGIQASDTVYADLADSEGFAKECALGRELGFDGKGAINPRQLTGIHNAFSPSADELAYAKRVVAAASDAEAAGSGAVALDGKMIDRPVLERALRVIKYSRELGLGGDAT